MIQLTISFSVNRNRKRVRGAGSIFLLDLRMFKMGLSSPENKSQKKNKQKVRRTKLQIYVTVTLNPSDHPSIHPSMVVCPCASSSPSRQWGVRIWVELAWIIITIHYPQLLHNCGNSMHKLPKSLMIKCKIPHQLSWGDAIQPARWWCSLSSISCLCYYNHGLAQLQDSCCLAETQDTRMLTQQDTKKLRGAFK